MEVFGMSSQKQNLDESNAAPTGEVREPDSELRLDGEDDNLYNDDLDIGNDAEPLAGTDGNNKTGPKHMVT
jgi:hypothetical protein